MDKLKIGQLMFIRYEESKDDFDWRYGVVTAIFDDRVIISTNVSNTVFYLTEETRKEHATIISRNGIKADVLRENGNPIILKPKQTFGILGGREYYVFPDKRVLYV